MGGAGGADVAQAGLKAGREVDCTCLALEGSMCMLFGRSCLVNRSSNRSRSNSRSGSRNRWQQQQQCQRQPTLSPLVQVDLRQAELQLVQCSDQPPGKAVQLGGSGGGSVMFQITPV